MERIRAVVVDPAAPGRLALREVEYPVAASQEALVKVEAFSLNRGEVRRANMSGAGWRPGWDLAGTVIQAAKGGTGPEEGTRVVGFLGEGAWAEVASVPVNALAALPDNVSFAQAATLPVAGLTALYALEKGGSLLDRSVLITGASGGVGTFALQLARLGGAHVTAAIRQPAHEEMVRKAGAGAVIVGEDLAGAPGMVKFDLILDTVSGKVLPQALGRLAMDGTCVLIGASGGSDVRFDSRSFFNGGGLTLYGFILFHEVLSKPASLGLARLARLAGEGKLQTYIEVEAPWSRVGEVANRLYQRQMTGKAVLHLKD